MSENKDSIEISSTKSHIRRDLLVENETKIRDKILCHKSSPNEQKKYFGTFPYPYMNGTLHLGHAYTAMRLDFTMRYKKLCGYNVLFPFAFHGTGTPIVTCADKVKNELNVNYDSLPKNSQLHILNDMGVSKDIFHKFVDPNYWIEYFSLRAEEDLKMIGVYADFTRKFTTTKLNPYYDSFVSWQFNILQEKGLLKFGKRNIIFSPKMNQPCGEHDRSIGEDVEVKDYTLIKFVSEFIYNGNSVYLLAATTRPDTILGVTNLWVHKNTKYCLFKFNDNYFVTRHSTFLNMSYQYENVELIEMEYMCGNDLIGKSVKLCQNNLDNSTSISIYHMSSLDPNKGTGIVMSVPSDSPIDYLHFKEIEDCSNGFKNKIISVNGDTSYAKTMVENNKIKLGNIKQIEEITKLVYETEQNEGIIMIGKYAGERVIDALCKIQDDLIRDNCAIEYSEPSGKVISRAGDECIVAKTDQWYINYGCKKFTEIVNFHIDNNLNMYNQSAHNMIRKASDWINEWPCSRHFGLGTDLPVDKRFVIDSLSDSTIYMCFYTISHLLNNIPTNMLSDDFWSQVFLGKEITNKYIEYKVLIEEMRKEFGYWYPMDIRVSGIDLIKNHLTMCLYNHAFVWENPNMFPLSYSVNEHILLNGEKMSKSTGNFLTLRESVDKYGADVTRIVLALSGDGDCSANFDEKNVNDITHLLINEREWIEYIYNEYKSNVSTIDTSDSNNSNNIWDMIFENGINLYTNEITLEVNAMNFRKGFVSIYKLLSVRDKYRNLHEKGILGTNRKYFENCMRFIEKFLVVMSIYAPFWTESIYTELNHGFNKEWPSIQSIDNRLVQLYDSFYNMTTQINKKKAQFDKKNPKGTKYDLSVTVYTKRDPIEMTFIEPYLNCKSVSEIRDIFDNTMLHAKKEEKNIIGQIGRNVMKNVGLYGNDWLEWCTKEQDDEYNMLKEWIPIMFEEYNSITINKFEGDSYNYLKNGPDGFHTLALTLVRISSN